MHKNKKALLFWLSVTLGSFIALIFFLLIAIPHFLGLNFVKSKISQELEKRYQVSTQIGSLSWRIFPSPRIILKETKIVSKGVSLSLPLVSAYPKLRPLLHHKIKIDKITLVKPELKISLSPNHPESSKLSKPITERLKTLSKKLASFSFTTELEVKEASVEIFKHNSLLFQATALNLSAHIEDSQITLKAHFHSLFSDEVSIESHANLKAGLSGGANFKNLKLERLSFPFLNWKIAKTNMNLALTFNFKSSTTFYLGFNIDFPCFRTQSPALLLEHGILQGTIFRKEGYWKLMLTKVKLDKPQIKGHGSLVINPQKPEIAYNFEAQELDITAVRRVTLSLFPQNKTVKSIFNIVKGGKAQNFRFSQKAPTKEGLKDLKSITIKSQARTASIDIPGPNLRLRHGQGNISIKKGILYGKALAGVIEGVKVKDGTMAIALKDPPGTLDIKTHFTASLKTGLFFLQKFVKNKQVRKELKLITKAEGCLSGQIAITGIRKAVKVDLSGILTKGEVSYQRLPYPAFIDRISFIYASKKITFQELKGRLGHSLVTNARGKIDFSAPQISIDIKNFAGRLVAQELDPWLKEQKFLKSLYQTFDLPRGEVEVVNTQFSYKFGTPASLYYLFNFKLKKGLLFLSFLPDKVHIDEGECFISPILIQFQNVKGTLGEDNFLISGEVKDPFTRKRQIKLQGKGKVTASLQDWCYQIGKLPTALKIKTPVQVKAFRLNHTPAQTHFEITLLNPQGIKLELNLIYSPQELFVKKLHLISKDGQESCVSFYLNLPKYLLKDFGFNGELSSQTLDALLFQNRYLTGKIKGNIQGQIDLTHIGASKLTGYLWLEGLRNIREIRGLVIGQVELRAFNQRVDFNKLALFYQGNILRAQGRIKFAPGALVIESTVFSPFVDWGDFSKLFVFRPTGKFPKIKLVAQVDAEIDSFQYGKFKFEDLKAFINLKGAQDIEIEVRKAYYCDLELKGNVKKLFHQTEVDVSFQAKNKDLDDFCYCLTKKRRLFKAKYNFIGTVKARGDKNPLQQDSTGTLAFRSEKGRIYKFTLLARIFSFLNVFEVLKGRLPDLNEEGLYYKYFEISAQLKNGVLKINSAVIDSPAMKIFGQGKVDVCQKKIKMTVLVAPLRTLDILISKIPILGKVLAGKSKTFVSIPLGVKGPLHDPEVIPLSPTAIGQGLFGLMKRVLGIPVEIIKPLTPEKKN
ncbi:MAG: AsmA-like C-terminal domain-containing protein [Candidatus Desulfofervidaceae bacterium]|nr:AsmA-like C-terminal domain-containing protein [Candidatus Desulfofervidaceae bacterium]